MKADAAIIWLHGEEETGRSWAKLEEALGTRLPWTKWYFPDAPSKKSWFPDFEFPIMDSGKDPAGLDGAIATVHAMISEVEANDGIKPSRIFIGGFGPGAALALLAGRTYSKRLAGIGVIAGWFLRFPEPSSAASVGTPVLLCHGEEDDDVPFEFYEEATRRLRKQGFAVTHYGYERFGHRDCATELTVLAAPKNFITACLPTLTPRSAPWPDRSAAPSAGRNSGGGAASGASTDGDSVGGEASGRGARESRRAPPAAASCQMSEAELERVSWAAAERLVSASEQAEREANTAGHVLKMEELPPAAGSADGAAGRLQAVITLNGVSSMAEVDLSVGSEMLELEVGGVAPLRVPLPKPVDTEPSTMTAKYSKKTGLLKVTLSLA